MLYAQRVWVKKGYSRTSLCYYMRNLPQWVVTFTRTFRVLSYYIVLLFRALNWATCTITTLSQTGLVSFSAKRLVGLPSATLAPTNAVKAYPSQRCLLYAKRVMCIILGTVHVPFTSTGVFSTSTLASLDLRKPFLEAIATKNDMRTYATVPLLAVLKQFCTRFLRLPSKDLNGLLLYI